MKKAAKKTAKIKKTVAKERPVVVTTEYRGVFFGYAGDTSGDTITLHRARNCIYWSADVKGFIGLATSGPSAKCRIGPSATIELRKVTSVVEASQDAVAAWESMPWA